MSDFRFLKNQELIEKLHGLAALEKKTTAEIVAVIAEVDRRKLFLVLGHTSLFSYLTTELAYTAASAQRRIDAARMLSAVPGLKSDLQTGALNLMQITVVSQSLRQKKKENPKVSVDVREKRELLNRVKGLDLIQTQKLVSQALDLEVQVLERKRIQKDESMRVELTLSKTQQEKLQLAREILSHKHPSLSWAELFSVLADELIKRRDLRRDPRRAQNQKEKSGELSQSLASIEIAVTEVANAGEKIELMQKNETPIVDSRMEAVLGQKSANNQFCLASAPQPAAMVDQDSTHKRNHPDGKLSLIKRRTSDDQKTSQQLEKPQAHNTLIKRKAIPLAAKREIHQRDQHCQWRDPITKRECRSRFQLEVDHRTPVCRGGGNHKENLQILCDVHNRLKWRKERLSRTNQAHGLNC